MQMNEYFYLLILAPIWLSLQKTEVKVNFHKYQLLLWMFVSVHVYGVKINNNNNKRKQNGKKEEKKLLLDQRA